jgi:DNA-binding transcriptional LysR family regulator
MNVSIRQLKAFSLVAELGNFTRAAERLHITQAGLSVMMGELEKQVGARLFDRTTRSVTLTAAGQLFLPAALAALQELEGAARQIAQLGKLKRQTLRLAATPMVSSNLLPTVFGSFRQSHPEVDIQLVDCVLHRVLALVDGGEVDFGLGFFLENKRGLDRMLLGSFQLMRVAPCKAGARQLAPQRGTTPWSSLHEATLLSLPSDNLIQQLVEAHLPDGAGRGAGRCFSHFDTIIAMVAEGMGTAVLPTFATPACNRYDVRTDVLCEPEVPLGFYRITKRGRAQPEFMAAFTDTMMSMLPNLANPSRMRRRSDSGLSAD